MPGDGPYLWRLDVLDKATAGLRAILAPWPLLAPRLARLPLAGGAFPCPRRLRPVRTLTPRQLAAVRAHVSEGTGKAAAYSLGISGRIAARAPRRGASQSSAVKRTEQAVYLLTVRGELRVEGARH
jgi:hypothetical protein